MTKVKQSDEYEYLAASLVSLHRKVPVNQCRLPWPQAASCCPMATCPGMARPRQRTVRRWKPLLELAAGADAGVALTGRLTGHPSTSGTFMKLKTYLLALRPWSLSASLVPTLLGSALAYRSQWAEEFSLATFFLTAFTVVTVHCAGNVVNTYFDFIKGIDKQKADDRTLVDHILTKDEVSNRTDGSIKPIECRSVHRA